MTLATLSMEGALGLVRVTELGMGQLQFVLVSLFLSVTVSFQLTPIPFAIHSVCLVSLASVSELTSVWINAKSLVLI